MQVDYMVLADAAAAENGKHYIHGAGWEVLWAPSFPVTHPMIGVAVRLRVPWTDTNQSHEVTLDIVDADGQSILAQPLGGPISVGRPANVPPGQDQTVALAFSLANMTFQRPGDYVVVVRIDSADQGRAPFRVAERQGANPVP